MPNWMTIRCKVSGTPEQIRDFRVFAFSSDVENDTQTIDFNKIIPMPKVVVETAEKNLSPEGHPCMGAAFFLLVLNHKHTIPDGLFRELELNPPPITAWPKKISDLFPHKKEIQKFLDAIDPKTGISTNPLSQEALVAAFRATTASVFGDNILTGKQMWCRDKIILHAPEYTQEKLDTKLAPKYADEQLRGLSMVELAEIWKTLPCFSENMKGGILQLRVLAETGYPSWYEWSLANWGTKWAVDEINLIHEDENHLDFAFATAFSFPIPIFVALGKKFPELELWCACIEEDSMDLGYGHFTPVNNGKAGGIFAFCEEDEIDFVYSLVFDEKRPNYEDDTPGEAEETDGEPPEPSP